MKKDKKETNSKERRGGGVGVSVSVLCVLRCWISLVLRPGFTRCPPGNVKFQVQSSFRVKFKVGAETES